MGSCDKCFEGRHVRCGGRGGCTCNICSPKPRAKQPKPIYNKTGRDPRPRKPAVRKPYVPIPKEAQQKRGVKPLTEAQKDEIAQQVLDLVRAITNDAGSNTHA